MKKIISLLLMMVLITFQSIGLASFEVTVPEEVLVSQSFAGLSSIPEAWTIGSTPATSVTYHDNYIQFDVGNKAAQMYTAQDVNTGESFKATFKAILNSNNVRLYAATDGMGNIPANGYVLWADNIGNAYNFTLHKNSVQVGSTKTVNENAAAFLSKENLPEFIFEITPERIKISASITVSEEVKKVELFDELNTGASVSAGIFGVKTGFANDFALSSIEIVVPEHKKPASKIVEIPAQTIANQSFAGLTALPAGWSATGNYNFDSSSISAGGGTVNATVTYDNAFDTNGLSYTLNFTQKVYDNANFVYFGDYRLSSATNTANRKNGAYQLQKLNSQNEYENLGERILDTTGGYGYQSLREFTIKVNTTANTITIINVAMPGGSYTVSDSSVSTSGSLKMYLASSNSDNRGAIGSMHLFVDAYTINTALPETDSDASFIVNSEEKTVSNYLVDKSFTSYDTIASAVDEGWALNGVQAINNGGVFFNDAEGYVLYTGAVLSGNYTVEFNNTYKSQNDTIIYINKNGGNYYEYSENNAVWTLKKYTEANPGMAETIDSGTLTSPTDEVITSYKVVVEVVDVDSLEISISSDTDININAQDTTNALTSGNFGFGINDGGDGTSYIKEIKAYPTTSEGVPKITGQYYVGASAVLNMKKGKTYLTTPTLLLGQNAVMVVAIYEGNEFVNVEMFDDDQLKSGVIELFDTSDYTYDNMKIVTFMWKSLDNLTPITTQFVLE